MPTPKHLSPRLLVSLLTFAAPLSTLAQNNAEQTRPPARATRSEARENTQQPEAGLRAATANPAPNREAKALSDAPPIGNAQDKKAEALSDGRPTSRPPNEKVEDLPFDAFPAKAAKREIQPRAVSDNVAAQLAARMPQYTPPPEPKPKTEDTADGELADLRDTDQPKNQILRLPDYVVREKKPPVFRERDIHSPSGLAALAASRYLSETGQALNRFRLPLFGGGAQAYALARYEEDERLRTIRDLNDTARDLGQLQNAETAVSDSAGSTWGIPPASGGASARRSSNKAEASLRRLIRDTTSRRATEPPSKLAQ